MKTSTKDKLLRLAKTGAKAALNVISPAASVASKLVTSNVGKKVVKESLQGQARVYAGAAEGLQRVGASAVKRATGVELPIQTLTPTGKVQKAIFGTDKPITARSVGEEVPFVKKGSKIAPVLGVALGTMDLIPGGKGITTALKNANKVDDVVRILKGGTKFADDVIKDIAPRIAQTTDENAIKTILSQVQRTVDPLLTEARKYKTAEEFVNSLGIARRGNQYENLRGVSKRSVQPDAFGEPLSGKGDIRNTQSVDEETVQRYIKQLNQNLENKTLDKNPPVIIDNYRGFWEIVDGHNRAEAYRRIGYAPDGVPIITKSQLTDIWKKAQRSTVPMKGTAEGLTAQPGAILPKLIKTAESTGQPVSKSSLPTSVPQSREVGKRAKELWTNVVEYVQNTDVRIRDIQKGKKVDDASNIYQKLALLPGRLGARVEQGKLKAQGIVEDVVSLTRGNNVAQSRTEINRYLQALHAPERNAALGEGAAGITTQEAKDILSKTPAEIKTVADKMLDLNREVLDILKESDVISDDLYNTLRNKYKYHVPLQRVMDEGDDIGSVLNAGLDVKSTGVMAAKGSQREVADIFTNILTNYEQAVIRAEKNLADKALVEFIRKNPETTDGLFTIRKPKALGEGFSGKPVLETTNNPQILQLRENGKPLWVEIKDKKLAIALRGVGREKVGKLLSAVGTFTRMYSGLATRFNPAFALPNKLRDLQEVATFLGAQADLKGGSAARLLAKEPQSIKDVTDALRGADTAGARLYEEMVSAGGTTGGMGLSTRKEVSMDVEKMFALAQSKPRQALDKLVQYVDNWNTIFEDSTRLSVYKTALESGLTKERAAFLAKEASINFNRMGQGGPVINALWMFSNASIQGSAKMIASLKNPKVAGAVAATMGISVAAISEWNDRVHPNWRDDVTKWDRMNGLPFFLPSDDGGVRYFVIPVSWGLKPVLAATNAVYDAVSGQEVGVSESMSDILSSIVDSYNPAGGTDFTSALVPTIADVPVEIARNQSWSGLKIRPDSDKNAPRDIQYFPSLKETIQGRGAIKATEALRDATGWLVSPADLNYVIDQYIGGAGRFMKQLGETAFGVVSGDTPPVDEFPFVSRFYRQYSEEEVGKGAGGSTDEITALLENQSRERFNLKNEAEDAVNELSSLPREVAAEKFDVLIETNPDLAEKVNDILEKKELGLNYTDRLIAELGVENGMRAQYIAQKFNELKSNEEKAALWDEYVTKKIITKEVAKQLSQILGQ